MSPPEPLPELNTWIAHDIVPRFKGRPMTISYIPHNEIYIIY